MASASAPFPAPLSVPLGGRMHAGSSAGLRPSFSAWRTLRNAALIIALLLLNKLGAAGAIAFFSILFAMVLYSSEAALVALVVGMLGLVSNMAIVPKSMPWTPLRLVLLFVCALRFSVDLGAMRLSLFAKRHYIALCLFVATAAACSVISGWYVQIALLKLISFWVGMTAVLSSVAVMRKRNFDVSELFLSVAAVVVMNSAAALVGGFGYGFRSTITRPGAQSFFQGAFYHPNSCGPFCAVLAVLLISTWLFSARRRRWICLLLVPPLLYFLWLSQSRTALACFFAGLVFVFSATALAGGANRLRLRLNTSRKKLLAYGFGLAFLAFMIDLGTQGRITSSLFSFIAKYDKKAQELEVESILATRQGLINRSWETFLERPLFGLGFEVSTDPYFIANATLFSAPIEKGFLPTAILEEVGVVGTIPFVIFLVTLIASLARAKNAPGLAVLLTYLMTNLGEVSIFAFGGTGALFWLLVAGATLIGDRCIEWRSPAWGGRSPLPAAQ